MGSVMCIRDRYKEYGLTIPILGGHSVVDELTIHTPEIGAVIEGTYDIIIYLKKSWQFPEQKVAVVMAIMEVHTPQQDRKQRLCCIHPQNGGSLSRFLHFKSKENPLFTLRGPNIMMIR